MAEKKIVPAHDQVRKLLDLIHYPDHDGRTESSEFRAIKEKWHNEGKMVCFINNGHCEGQIEVHHSIIEYSTSNEIDWERVKADHGFDHVDSESQMMPLCHKHHMGVGTGIHMVTYPAWILQKYMKPDALALFEEAVVHLKDNGHDDHSVNHAAKKMLIHMGKQNEGEAVTE